MKRRLLISGLVILTLSGCGGGGGGSSAVVLPLELVSLSPADGATDVAISTTLSATLSQEIDCSAIPADPLLLEDAAANAVSGTVGCSGDTLTFTPGTALAYSTSYTATLKAGIPALTGVALDIPSSWGFTTAADTTGPVVQSVTPADSATDIALATTLSATFDEALDCSTVTSSSFTLNAVGGGNISGNTSCSGSAASFTPDAQLGYGTAYTATLTSAVSDTAGNPMAADFGWSFTTVADSEAPVLDITSHADGDTFTATHTITLTGTAGDNDSVASLSVSINGGAATPLSLSGGSFSSDLTFSSYSNEVVVSATDTAGNSSSATLNLYYVATGLLDTNLNTVGYNTFDGGAATPSHDSGESVVIADDGSFYIAGYARDVTGTGYDMALWHLLADGTADAGFDGDGLALLVGPAGGTGHDFAKGVAIDSNGKIVVVGHSASADGDYDLVVARFLSDGRLDMTFGGDVNPLDGSPDGFVVIDVSGSASAEEGNAVVLDADDNIYVAGNTNAAGDNDMTVWRFTPAGALDTSFAGGAGYLSYDSGGADAAKALTMDTYGNLLLTGEAGGMAIWRVTPAGVSDTAFNGSGVAVSAGVGYGITTDANGNILVAGSIVISGNLNDMALWRYTSSGVPDTTFGGDYDIDGTPDGYVTHDGAGLDSSNDFDYGYGVAVDAAGNLLVTGSSVATHSGSVKPDMVVWRYTTAGVLDSAFGDDVNPVDGTPDGFFTHNGAAGGNNVDQGKAIVIDALGRVVVAGESSAANDKTDMAIWRLY